MHNLGEKCVQAVYLAVDSLVRTAAAKLVVCTKLGLCAAYTKVCTTTVHSLSSSFASVKGLLVHIIHTPYISSNMLNRLLIINKHSGELL